MPYCAHCGSFTEQVSHAPCPSCGNPTNGAPPQRVVAGTGGSNPAVIIVVVVVGFFLVIAIIGILAAIAIPNLINAQQRARQKRTMADMRSIATAAEAYAVDNNVYPPAESIDQLRPLLVPKYIKTIPPLDGWGNELRYRCLDDECQGYAITSSGSDKMFEHVTAAEYERNETNAFDADVVFINGEFIQGPEGSVGGGQ
jgi:competence protein ComGC